MNPDTSRIHNLANEEDREKLQEMFDTDTAEIEKRMVAMTEKEVEQIREPEKAEGGINYARRKGYMRNKPCPCGSGKKFKKCHWSEYKTYLNQKRKGAK